MAEVIPFRGILYNTDKVSGSSVVAPPYDIISPELKKNLYGRSQYNIVRIDFGAEQAEDNETENKYIRASHYLKEWLDDGILTKSLKPCFYAYEMDYRTSEGQKKLAGFFGLVRIEELGNGVYPHEETHSKPKADRLNLMTACRANTSPIFSIYNSAEKKASAVVKKALEAKPYMEAEDLNGETHRLWVIDKEEDVIAIKEDMKNRDIFIADGHHRYETALEYRRIMRERHGRSISSGPYDYVLMFLANIADGDITILPTHRIVRFVRQNTLETLSGHFEIETIPVESDIIRTMKGKSQTFGYYHKGDAKKYLLRYKGNGMESLHPALRGLDVTILHELIFKELKVSKILYEMDASTAIEKVRDSDYDAAFFLNPTKVEDVERVALSAMRMPPKSTYFYPKVMTGFIINSLESSA